MTSVLRWVSGSYITGAVPCELVEETSEFVALFQPGGTRWMRAAGERTGPRGRNMLPAARDGHEETEWTGDGVLRLHCFGDEWSTWRWLSDAGEWSDYFYINLEDPWRRTDIGFDSGDWELDIVGTPASWTYKDEDELAWSEQVGLVTPDWAERTRAAGRRASEALESNAWPFSADWNRWLPAPGATLPALPGLWSQVDQPGDGV